MYRLKDKLEDILKEHCDRVYFFEAPDSSKAPYIVYDITPARNLEGLSVGTLSVDVWEYGRSSKLLDDLCYELRKGLDRLVYKDDDTFISLLYDREIHSKSGNKDWKRKTVFFNMRFSD